MVIGAMFQSALNVLAASGQAAAAQHAIDTGATGQTAVARMLASGLVSMKNPGMPLVPVAPVGAPSAAAAAVQTRAALVSAPAQTGGGMSTGTMAAIGGGVALLGVIGLVVLKKKKKR